MSASEHRGGMGEQRESMREHGGSMLTKRALVGEQSGDTSISSWSRVAFSSGKLYIYIYSNVKYFDF